SRVPVVLGIGIPLFQPGNLQIAPLDVANFRLLIRFPVRTERFHQHVIEGQLLYKLGRHAEDRDTQIAAFDGRRPVVQMHRTFPWFDDPVARVIEPNQTAIDYTDRVAWPAFPSVFILEFEFFDAHDESSSRHANDYFTHRPLRKTLESLPSLFKRENAI